jgi:hypothetical protein
MIKSGYLQQQQQQQQQQQNEPQEIVFHCYPARTTHPVITHLRTSVDFGIQMCSVAGARLPLADVARSHHPQLLTALMGV